MAKKRKVDFNLASEIFDDAGLSDNEILNIENQNTVKNILLNTLHENPYQPRLYIDKDKIQDLANSIQENGLLQPITVLKNNSSDYTIIYGHRRVAAFKLLNKTTIPSIVLEEIKEKELIIKPIIENLQRQDMDPLETAIALLKIIELDVVKTQEELSQILGISQSRVSKLISISKLSDTVLSEIQKVSYKDVTVLSALNSIDKSLQKKIFKEIVNLSRADALEIIKKYKQGRKVTVQRIVKANNRIVINTKNLSKDVKDSINIYIQKIEKLLKSINHE